MPSAIALRFAGRQFPRRPKAERFDDEVALDSSLDEGTEEILPGLLVTTSASIPGRFDLRAANCNPDPRRQRVFRMRPARED
jgi:hypothetical protein